MGTVYSMTGYAVATTEVAGNALNAELRSVNHRYLDIQFRMPEEMRAAEPALRELLAAKLKRGKIECRISTAARPEVEADAELDAAVLRQLDSLAAQVRTEFPDARPLSTADILRWPGVVISRALPTEQLRDALQTLVRTALGEFEQARAREGEKLKELLLERAARIDALVAEITPRIPRIVEAYREKLAQRLRDALGTEDAERLRQEVVLFAGKVDVDEELTRLATHVAELRRVLAAGGAVGKRLDFLMQELNREANTLGSKAADIGITQAALEFKLLIEQMREQIQNIE